MAESGEVTAILAEFGKGDRESLQRLIPIVYKELRRLAGYYLKDERPGHTLQATALVHEAYLRLAGSERLDLKNRSHFFGVAAQVMRNILVDHARTRGRSKRGGGRNVALDDIAAAQLGGTDEILAVNDALSDLARVDPRQARIVELRYFGGLTIEEIANLLEISERTVKRDWQMAKAWLCGRIRGVPGDSS